MAYKGKVRKKFVLLKVKSKDSATEDKLSKLIDMVANFSKRQDDFHAKILSYLNKRLYKDEKTGVFKPHDVIGNKNYLASDDVSVALPNVASSEDNGVLLHVGAWEDSNAAKAGINTASNFDMDDGALIAPRLAVDAIVDNSEVKALTSDDSDQLNVDNDVTSSDLSMVVVNSIAESFNSFDNDCDSVAFLSSKMSGSVFHFADKFNIKHAYDASLHCIYDCNLWVRMNSFDCACCACCWIYYSKFKISEELLILKIDYYLSCILLQCVLLIDYYISSLLDVCVNMYSY